MTIVSGNNLEFGNKRRVSRLSQYIELFDLWYSAICESGPIGTCAGTPGPLRPPVPTQGYHCGLQNDKNMRLFEGYTLTEIRLIVIRLVCEYTD